MSKQTDKAAAIKELAIRKLEEMYKPQQESLMEFIKLYWKEEEGKEWDNNWHYDLIEEKLQAILDGEINRLMVNVPPGSGKTEQITKFFPVWAMGKRPDIRFICTSHAADLAQKFSYEARKYYKSNTFRKVFPRHSPIADDQDTKALWVTEAGGQYLATGSAGNIIGNRANIFIIDDPIKPDEADKSDLKREDVNSWFGNTVVTRLFRPSVDAIIIIMQRTHQNDLCGYLQDREASGAGSKWEKVVLPAIATETDKYREKGEPLQANRYDIKELDQIKSDMASEYGTARFETQYQQNPVSKETQIFHEEWFRYYDHAPSAGRLFIAVDPAFSKKASADQTAMVVGRFIGDAMYIEEIIAGRYDPHEFEDKLIYLVKKWTPEKVGIESVAAQATISFSFRTRLQKEGIHTVVENIKQKGDKESKIQRLQPLYRNGRIYHKRHIENMTLYESQLIGFPRAAHDDMIDAAQMLYEMYTLQPDMSHMQRPSFKITYDDYGKPVIVQNERNVIDF